MVRIFDSDTFREIVETLSRNKSRTILTGFGVFWGIFMLLAMMGGGNGLKDLLQRTFDGFATNSGFVASNTTTKAYKGFKSNREWSLTTDDVRKIKTRVQGLDIVAPIISVFRTTIVKDDISSNRFNVKGVVPDYSKVETPRLKYGRYINLVDIQQNRKVCVIGKEVYEKLFPEGGDPCGKRISVDGNWFVVVGVDFAEGNISINGDASSAVSVPLTVVQQIYNMGKTVHLIGMTAKPGYKMKPLLEEVKTVVQREHYINPTDDRAVFTLNTELLFSIMDNLFKGVDILIWLVGIGTLIAGAIGVSNIMMVTVKERTTEIGIRRAIGATPSMILSQIMTESVALTFVSGMAGIFFSVLVLSMAELAATKDGVLLAHFQVSFGTAILAVLMLTAFGLLAGLAPALRAMNIKPVDAMRDE